MENNGSIAVAAVFLAITLAGLVLITAAAWRILTKAGEKGWKALIPIYNLIVIHKIVGMSNVWLLIDLILCALGVVAPLMKDSILWIETTLFVVSSAFTLVYEIIIINKLCNVFGKGDGFKLGTFFLPLIFIPILGFGKARYAPPGTEHPDKPFTGSPAARIRRLENNLTTLGGGIVALSVWVLIKIFLVFIFYKDELGEALPFSEWFIVYVIVGVLSVIYFLMYCIAGLCAVSEGSGKKRRYLLLTGFIILLQSSSLLLEVLFFTQSFDLSTVISLIFDGSVLIFLIELISSSITLRRLRKQQAQQVQKGEHYEF